MPTPPNSTKLLDDVRNLMRRRHYSRRTEKSYFAWITQYVKFYQMRGREDLQDGERKIEQFLTYLAVERQVAPSTQNQAMNALVFLYKQVLKDPLDQTINAQRAPKRKKYRWY